MMRLLITVCLPQVCDADVLAAAMVYTSTEARCANQAFNVSNGDVFRWEQVSTAERWGATVLCSCEMLGRCCCGFCSLGSRRPATGAGLTLKPAPHLDKVVIPSSRSPERGEIMLTARPCLQMWPRLAEFFGLPVAEPMHMALEEAMADKGPLWDRIVQEHGLQASLLALDV